MSHLLLVDGTSSLLLVDGSSFLLLEVEDIIPVGGNSGRVLSLNDLPYFSGGGPVTTPTTELNIPPTRWDKPLLRDLAPQPPEPSQIKVPVPTWDVRR